MKNMILARKDEFYKVRYFNKSHYHSLKLRYTQAIAFLFHLDPTWDDRTVEFILHEANQTNVKYICELIVAETMKPDQLFPIIGKVIISEELKNEKKNNRKLILHFRSKVTAAAHQCSKLCTTFVASTATANTLSHASTFS